MDRHLLDPQFAIPAGDTCYPATRGHSDYFADLAFAAAVREVRHLRQLRQPRQPPVPAPPPAD